MRFEARELTTHARPVAGDALEPGTVYFSLTFLDDDMLVPLLEPLVFIGKDLRAGDADRVYFQDLPSFRRGVAFDPLEANAEPMDNLSVAIPTEDPEHAMFYVAAQSDATNIFEYERAVDELLKCSLRRKQR